jgi:alpha-1,2-mannosyltransferase
VERRIPGLAAAVLAVTSIAAYAAAVRARTHAMASMGDLGIYRAAAASVDAGRRLYDVRYPPLHMPFTYTPFAALVFVPLSWSSWDHVRTAVAVANVAAVFACAAAALRLAAPGMPKARLLTTSLALGGVALWTEPVQQTLLFGQVNLLLLLLVLVDLNLDDDTPFKGVLIGLAAAMKLTPAVLIAYLVVTGRRASAARATLAVAATMALGAVVLPGPSRTYWTHDVFTTGRIGNPAYLGNQSIKGALVRLLGFGPLTSALWAGLAACTIVIGLLWGRRLHRVGRDLAGATVVAVAGLLASPISWSHHWVWVIPALALAWDAARRTRAVTVRALPVLALVTFAAWWVARPGVPGGAPGGILWLVPGKHDVELTWSLGQTLVGDLYVEVALLVAAATGAAALLRRRSRGLAGLPAAGTGS